MDLFFKIQCNYLLLRLCVQSLIVFIKSNLNYRPLLFVLHKHSNSNRPAHHPLNKLVPKETLAVKPNAYFF